MSHPNRPAFRRPWFWRCSRSGACRLRHRRPARSPRQPQAAPVPTLPPAFPPQDIVGRWGLAAYHKEEDRAAHRSGRGRQCKQPYVITLGPTGGVMMHLADQATPAELRLKGAPGGKTYIGPDGERPAARRTAKWSHSTAAC